MLASVKSLHLAYSDQFKSENARRLLGHWQAKRGQRPRPAWSDIDLMEIYKVAPCVCVRDVISSGKEFLCRYWGTELVNSYQVDCTGKVIHEVYSSTGIENTLEIYRQALASDKPLRLIGNLSYADQSAYKYFEGIMLRLDGADYPDQHIIGAFQFDFPMDTDDRKSLLDENFSTEG